jgi:hypothetical protein
MRILLLACAVLAVMPCVASAQITVIEVTEEELQAIEEQQMVGREIHRAVDELERRRLEDPAYRSARVAGARVVNERTLNALTNPGHFERERELAEFHELELSDKESGQLLDLLAELDVRDLTLYLDGTSTRVVDYSKGITPEVQAAAGEWLQRRSELQLEREEGLTALLGPERYKRWQQYLKNRKRSMSALVPPTSQQSIEVIYRLTEIKEMLGKSNQPLSMPQVMPLAEALAAGVQRERLKAGMRDDEDAQSVSSAHFQYAARKRVTENLQGILEIAAPHLKQSQLAALRAGFDPDRQ